MNRFFFNKTSQQEAKMNQFTVLESLNRLSTNLGSGRVHLLPVTADLALSLVAERTEMELCVQLPPGLVRPFSFRDVDVHVGQFPD